MPDRTQALFGDFCKTFEDADELVLTEIYPASEKPIPGVSGAWRKFLDPPPPETYSSMLAVSRGKKRL